MAGLGTFSIHAAHNRPYRGHKLEMKLDSFLVFNPFLTVEKEYFPFENSRSRVVEGIIGWLIGKLSFHVFFPYN